MSSLKPVLLSGGSGTRLWPLSTPERPKQFVPLFGGQSLFDLTLARLDGIEDVAAPIVVTGAAHLDLVESALQTRGVENTQVVVEPIGRNTAPAAIAAALISEPDDIMVILPSDHLIAGVDGFQQAVGLAAGHAREGAIVTFGIEPTRPETGYGYIEIGNRQEPGAGQRVRSRPSRSPVKWSPMVAMSGTRGCSSPDPIVSSKRHVSIAPR